MVRFYDNLKVAFLLIRLLCKFKDIRFTQLLFNLDIDPNRDYNEEPNRTLIRIKNTASRWNGNKL